MSVTKTKGRFFTVAEYLDNQIAVCGVTQREIAEHLGYEKANIITMFKQGLTKLPVNKVEKMAHILGVDSKYLLRLVLTEYLPDMLPAIESIIGGAFTDNESEMVEIIRKVTKNTNPAMQTSESKAALKAFAKTL